MTADQAILSTQPTTSERSAETQKRRLCFKTMGDDTEWLSKDVLRGLFWSDTSVLSALETEMITFAATACQGLSAHVPDQPAAFLQAPLTNHLGGLRALGMSLKQAAGVTAAAANGDKVGWERYGCLGPAEGLGS